MSTPTSTCARETRRREAREASTSRAFVHSRAMSARADAAVRRLYATFSSDGGGGASASAASGTYRAMELASDDVGDSCPFAVRFNNTCGTWVAIGDQNGTMTVLDAASAWPSARETGADYNPYWIASAHDNAVFDVAWTCDDKRLLTASADHTVAMFDAETKVLSARFEGHDACVKALATQPTSRDVFATGGRDGRLLVFDARASTRVVRANEDAPYLSPKRVVNYAHKTPGARRRSRLHSVTSAAFDNGGGVLLSSGGSDGVVKMWDLRQMKSAIGALEDAGDDEYVRGSFHDAGLGGRFGGERGGGKRPRGISGIAIDPMSSRVVVSYVDNHMAMFDSNDPKGKPIRHFVGHQSTSFYVKPCFSPDGDHVACGSLDHDVHIWSVRRADAASIRLKGHTAGVNCVHWSKRLDALASCADDGATRLWRVDPSRASEISTPPTFTKRRSRPTMHPRILRALGRDVDASSGVASPSSPGVASPSSPGAPTTPRDRTPSPALKIRKITRAGEESPLRAVDVNVDVNARER